MKNPDAIACLKGSSAYPNIQGTVKFYKTDNGSWVSAEVFGLPPYRQSSADSPQIGPFGFHIHENGECGSPDGNEPFSAAGPHWNPTNQPHGNHAGDFPVLLADLNGTAEMLFFTDRFFPEDVVGKTVMIHQSPDDYRTQPSGGSGMRIACGSIKKSE